LRDCAAPKLAIGGRIFTAQVVFQSAELAVLRTRRLRGPTEARSMRSRQPGAVRLWSGGEDLRPIGFARLRVDDRWPAPVYSAPLHGLAPLGAPLIDAEGGLAGVVVRQAPRRGRIIAAPPQAISAVSRRAGLSRPPDPSGAVPLSC
jgi:hypothetical protein